MALSRQQRIAVNDVLKSSLRRKFQNYQPESKAMPFHTRLLGKDRLALFSFIHSLNTTFGTSIFEPVAAAVAGGNFKQARTKVSVGDSISEEALSVIQELMDGLATATRKPNKPQEIDLIRDVCNKGKMRRVKLTLADVSLVGNNDELLFIDLKSAKPNIGEFKGFKRTLLEWVAAALASRPKAVVHTLIGIPYNPYEPKPYNRWTMRGMIDLDNELKVAGELWDFLGGEGTYEVLLECFEEVGIELRSEIDEYFTKFRT